jgi:hypothetical protein
MTVPLEIEPHAVTAVIPESDSRKARQLNVIST